MFANLANFGTPPCKAKRPKTFEMHGAYTTGTGLSGFHKCHIVGWAIEVCPGTPINECFHDLSLHIVRQNVPARKRQPASSKISKQKSP